MTETERKAFHAVWQCVVVGKSKEENITSFITELKTRHYNVDEQIHKLENALKQVQEARKKSEEVLNNYQNKNPLNYNKWSKECMKTKKD